jgi:hypothetical protein
VSTAPDNSEEIPPLTSEDCTILIVYSLAQKYFTQGVVLSGVKG